MTWQIVILENIRSIRDQMWIGKTQEITMCVIWWEDGRIQQDSQ